MKKPYTHKEIKQTIRSFKKTLKSGIYQTIWRCSDWDIYLKQYTVEEIAARFLRKQGYKIKIEVSDDSTHPSYCFGSVRFYRYGRIILN